LTSSDAQTSEKIASSLKKETICLVREWKRGGPRGRRSGDLHSLSAGGKSVPSLRGEHRKREKGERSVPVENGGDKTLP